MLAPAGAPGVPGAGGAVSGAVAGTGDGLAPAYNTAIYDADLTARLSNVAPQNTTLAAERDATRILKVTPDRTCAQWLACQSYIKDEHNNNVCFDIGLCDAVDANGECRHFILEYPPVEQILAIPGGDTARFSNISGYAKTGVEDVADPGMAGLYSLGAMSEAGVTVPSAGTPNRSRKRSSK